MMFSNKVFYTLKPILPRPIQLSLRRWIIQQRLKKFSAVWPIDEAAGQAPSTGRGGQMANNSPWSCPTMWTASVPRQRIAPGRTGKVPWRAFLVQLRAERYKLSRQLIEEVKALGFEVCVHGLTHDGKLFWSKEIFAERAVKINAYLKDWGSVGFTSPSMHHNLEWMNLLEIEHATSTFDTDPFEPEPDGCGTIFPYWVAAPDNIGGYVELP